VCVFKWELGKDSKILLMKHCNMPLFLGVGGGGGGGAFLLCCACRRPVLTAYLPTVSTVVVLEGAVGLIRHNHMHTGPTACTSIHIRPTLPVRPSLNPPLSPSKHINTQVLPGPWSLPRQL